MTDAVLQMAEIGIDIPLAQLYEGITVPNEPDNESASSENE